MSDNDAYLPSFHPIGRDLKIDRVAVRPTLAIYLFCFALMMPRRCRTRPGRRVISASVIG